MRVLWTLPYLPWPTTSGGKTRQYHLLRSLAQRGHQITLLVQSKIPPSEAARQALELLLERLIVLPRRAIAQLRSDMNHVSLWLFSVMRVLVQVN